MAELNTQIVRVDSDLRCDLQFNVYDRLDILSLKIDQTRTEAAEKFGEISDRFEAIDKRFDEVNNRIDAHRKETAEKFDAVNQRFGRLEARMERLEARMERLEARFDKFDAEFYPKIAEVMRDALSAVGITYDPKFGNHKQRISSLEWSRKCGRPVTYLSSSKFELMR